MYHTTTIFAILLILSTTVCECKRNTQTTQQRTDRAARRLNHLNDIYAAQTIAPLADSNFSRYIFNRPRDYHALVMFTASAPQYQCSVCPHGKFALADVSEHYHDQFNFMQSPALSRIAFFSVDVDDARQTFADMGIETVPRWYLLPPNVLSSPKMAVSNYEINANIFLEGADHIFDEIYAQTKVKIERTVEPVPLLVGIGILVALIALFVCAAQHMGITTVLLWYQQPLLWSVFSAACFAVGVSGCIFCIIKSAPNYGMSRTGVQLFSMSGRDQFLVEGFVVAAWSLGAGLVGTILLASTKIRFPVLRHCLTLVSMAVLILLLLQIFGAYQMKTQWYTIKETLPADVWGWFTASVKKNSPLSKRLYRISEIWLLETKAWAHFQKKFKLLIIDYLVRTLFPPSITPSATSNP